MPPFFLSFLLSSPFSSFYFLLSFLPFFFFSFLLMKNVSFFSWPLIQICTFRGGGGVGRWVGRGKVKTHLHSFFCFLSFFPSFFLPLLPLFFSPLFFPPFFLLFLFSVDEKCVIFFPAFDANLYFQGGGGKVLIVFQPKNTLTFLFLPPFFLSFLFSFPPFLPPFFFFSFLSMKNVSFFFRASDLNLFQGVGRWVGWGKVLIAFQPKNTFTFLFFFLSFFPSFFLPLLPLFFSPSLFSLLPCFLSSFPLLSY